MTVRILLTDAYSTTNLGDGELVRRSLQYAKSRGEVMGVLATDPRSFEAMCPDVPLFLSPMSRIAVASRTGLSSLLRRGSETAALCSLLLLGILPIPKISKRRAVGMLGKFVRYDWYVALASAELVIPVGGGYLGDKYLKRTIVSTAYYWCAGQLGATVETMPLSISSLDNRQLRRAVKFFGANVRWRAREGITFKTLYDLGHCVVAVPDLAWRNASQENFISDGTVAGPVVVAPVGSDFYARSSEDSERILNLIDEAIGSTVDSAEIVLVAMHCADPLLNDGHDDQACLELAEAIRNRWSSARVCIREFSSYGELVSFSKQASVAVSERLHAAIAFLSQGVPTIVRGYEPKHEAVLRAAEFSMNRAGDAIFVTGERDIRQVALAQKRLLDVHLPLESEDAA